MLALQRDEKIVAALRQEGVVSAAELASELGVSAATIRRDLERLERQGVLARIHGGAIKAADDADESAFDDVVDADAAEKDAVAVAAARLVADGDVVLLDIGTTTMRIAQQLRGRPVTVVTTSLAALDVLRGDDLVEVILIGGSLRRNFRSFVGPLAEDALRSIRGDVCFLACTGIRPDGSVVDDISQEASIKRALISAADRTVLVATAAKFPGTGSLRITNIAQIDTVVAGAEADRGTLDHCTRSGGQVLTV